MAKASIKEFVFKQEAEPGVVEALTSAEVLVRVRTGSLWTPEVDTFETEEVQGNSSPPLVSIGRQMLRAAIEYLLRGPGDLVTAPAITPLLEASMFDATAAKTIAIGAVTGGPYLAGEVITGGTSLGTGMVLQQTATGAASIPYIPLTGTLQTTETLTGADSGATSTSSGAPASAGYGYRPADLADSNTPGHHGTFRGIDHLGIYEEGRGALANLEFAFENGRPVIVSQEFLAALSAHGDGALYDLATYPEEAIVAPRALNVGLKIGSYTVAGLVNWTLSVPIGASPVEDANDTAGDGVTEMDYDRRGNPPTLTLDPKRVTEATWSPLTLLQAGAGHNVEWTIGTVAGSKWTFVLPKAQVIQTARGQREPDLLTNPITLRATGDNNNEVLIWQH